MLHNDKDLFERVVLDTSEKYCIVPVIIEKDYCSQILPEELEDEFERFGDERREVVHVKPHTNEFTCFLKSPHRVVAF